ncbi:RNA-binding protein 28 [Rhopalosiphum maidis]|uniref:RNA-binding protein 28 n=1 Tax=Rhopalosiphum maidis TaxID=43146 RepID=UPI000F00C326|nr:RNA-binding protein 28 [Rhopalosiphum maidis]
MKDKIFFAKNKAPKNANNRRGRLIIRNLPFTTNEEQLKEHFSKFGEINDIKLLRKPDGKLIGCGFVQFIVKQNAAKAIAHTSGKDFGGRSIVVDWAIPKNKYETIHTTKEKEENISIKEENVEAIVEDQEEIKEVLSDDQNNIEKSKTVEDYLTLDTIKEECDNNFVDFETTDNENDVKRKREDNDENESVISTANKKRFKSHDVKEGLTVFFKNVSFSVNNDELKRFVKERFGPIYYALVCVDRLTEHSKGTAFVKFRDSSSVEACMSSSPEDLTLNGSTMEPQMAIDKEVLDKNKDDKVIHKDNRNLYLIKEGVIIAGTAAANGVSVHDMNKRLELEQWKSQVLKNLNMFVARNRLIIHNLPANMDNKNLKDLFTKYTRPNAVLKVVVMRNLKKVDPKGVPISKEYAFVTFKQHEDALKALRSINNNPNIFNSNKRPIVAFSIENRLVLQARQRRIDKSKTSNPLFNKQQPNTSSTVDNKNKKFNTENNNKNNRSTALSKKKTADLPEYTGITAKEGHMAIRSKFKLKIQSEAHQKNVKTKKKLTMKKKRDLAIRNEKKREPKVKSKKKNTKNDASFSKLVNKYKNKISAPETMKKWYEA